MPNGSGVIRKRLAKKEAGKLPKVPKSKEKQDKQAPKKKAKPVAKSK